MEGDLIDNLKNIDEIFKKTLNKLIQSFEYEINKPIGKPYRKE